MAKNFKDNKSWFFTTFGVVAYLASFEELNAIIKEDEVAFGRLRQPNKKGDCFILLPPYEISWELKGASDTVELITVTITACTGNISCHSNCFVRIPRAFPRPHQRQALSSFVFLQRLATIHFVEGEDILAAEIRGPYAWRDARRGNNEAVLGGNEPTRCC